MDLLKWYGLLFPLLPSHFGVRALRVAIQARTIDMRASPYDVEHWFSVNNHPHSLPVTAIPVETASGRAEYVREQRRIAEIANALRGDMIEFMRGIR